MTSSLAVFLSSDTVQQMEDMHYSLWDKWTWDPPRQPMPYTLPKPKEVTPPYLSATRTFPPFQRHKFRLGGSKK